MAKDAVRGFLSFQRLHASVEVCDIPKPLLHEGPLLHSEAAGIADSLVTIKPRYTVRPRRFS